MNIFSIRHIKIFRPYEFTSISLVLRSKWLNMRSLDLRILKVLQKFA